METTTGITHYFGKNLAELLAGKICTVHKEFDKRKFIKSVEKGLADKTLIQRVEWIADNLRTHLPSAYPDAIAILKQMLGPENKQETGMFTKFYWLMPVGKFVEKYGLDHYTISIATIAEITKRNTGEYAIRPYVRKHPERTVRQMKKWAGSKNFHLRRLASEGLRPKLPWASKLEVFIEQPQPVFDILEILKEDPVRFVKKSVANHLSDYVKVNPREAFELINTWKSSGNEHTQWIIRQATRKLGK